MAQLKDSIVSGNLRVTDETLTDSLQVTTINAPTAAGGSTYGAGTNGQVLKSNGTSTYWGDDSSGSPSTTVTAVSSSASAGTATTYSRGDHTHNISVATGDANGQVKIAGQNASVKGLGDAAYKGVTDNSSSTAVTSTDTNLITGRTLYYAGYTKNTGTVTSVKVGDTSYSPSSGVVSLPAYPTTLPASDTTSTYSPTGTAPVNGQAVADALSTLPEPMIFRGSLGTGGTITTLPVDGTASVGDTYKVITDGTYASQSAKVGDTFICDSKTSTANTWTLIPSGDEPSGTVTSVTIKATSPIAIDSSSAITTSGTRTISHANSGVTAGTYKSVTVNATGHVTGGSNPTTLSGYGITDAVSNVSWDSTNNKLQKTINGTTSDVVTASTILGNLTSSQVTGALGYTPYNSTNPSGYTSNTGTVTKVSTGAGLTGGDITSTGTVKANLLSETKLTNDSSAATEVSGRVYPVALDKSGKLAVNVPWTDTHGEVTSVAGKTGDVTLTNSDVGLGNVGNFKAVSTEANQGLTDTEKSNARSNIGAGTSNLTIGTTATTAMAGNKTFTTSIAADSGTNQLSLSANTKYKLTAGGTSYIFTTPQDTTYSAATTSADGLMSSADKTKLNGIATGAEVNQNAFSNIAVSGQTTVAADSKTDTLTLVAGDNVTITTDATNDKVTISAQDTTYSSKAAASGGTDVSLVTTGEKYTWNNKQNALTRPVTGAATWTAADVITVTNASSGNVIKSSGKTISTSITNVDTNVPTSKAVKTYVDTEVSTINESLDTVGEILENEQTASANFMETGCKNKIDLSSGAVLDVTGYGIHCWIDPASGEIHLDGINDGKACTGAFNIQVAKTSRMGMITGEIYNFSCIGYNTSNTTIGLYVYTAGLTPNNQFDSYEHNELAWNSGWNNDNGTTNGGIRLFIREGTVVDNVVLKPMICEKFLYDISNFFEPFAFSNKVITPQSKKCTDSGIKNLLDCSVEKLRADKFNSGGSYGYTWVDNVCTSTRGATFTVNKDGSITVYASSTTGDIWFRLAEKFTFSSGTYVMSGCPMGGSTSSYMMESDDLNARDTGNGVTITRNSEISDNIYIVILSGQTVNLTFKPMICKSEKYAISNSFTPHNVIGSSRRNLLNFNSIKRDNSNYGTSVKTEGVRFTLNPDGTIIVNREDASSNTAWITFCMSGFNNVDAKGFCDGNHVLSGCPSGGSDSTYRLYAAKGTYAKYDTGSGVLLSSTTETVITIVIAVYGGAAASNLVFKPMICSIEDWRESTEFVPFIPDIQEVSQAVIKAIDDGAKNLCSTSSGSATAQWIDIPLVLDLGIYMMSVGNLASTDTDATTCQIGVFDTSWNNILGYYPQLERGRNVYKRLIVSRKSAVLRIYSSDTSAHGSGDTLSFTDLMVCREADFNVSQKYEPFALPNPTLTPAAIKAVDDGTKNLLVLTDTATTTTSGVTLTYYGDGTYKVNGTATADGYFYLARSDRNDVFRVGNVISGCTGGSSSTFYLTISATSLKQTGDPLTLTSNYSGSLLFSFKSGQTFSNKVIKPMVCTTQDWNISQEFKQSALPNPILTPAVVESVNSGTTGSKNLLYLSVASMKAINTSGTWNGNQYTNQGITYTINADGTITTSGTASSSANSVLNLYKFTSSSFLGNTYSFSGCPSGGDYNNSYALYVNRSPDNLISGSAETGSGVIFNVPSDALYYRILVRKSYNMSSKTFKPMICTVPDYNVSKDFVKFKGNTLIHDYIQISLSSLTWTASASGLYYSNAISVSGISEIWMACLSGFASLRTTDNITVACRSSYNWNGLALWANTNSFVSGAWVTVSVLGI